MAFSGHDVFSSAGSQAPKLKGLSLKRSKALATLHRCTAEGDIQKAAFPDLLV